MISVVVGTCDFDEYAIRAIDSILDQTYRDFELIIVANGISCHEIASHIADRYSNDSRIRILKSQIPQLAHALNIGIDNAAYDYIARMDTDDIAWPDRLEKQLNYLQENDLDLVGCGARLIDANGKVIGTRQPPRGERLGTLLNYKNVFMHPTIIARKSLFISAGGYSGLYAEDYGLWLRLRHLGVRWDNMEETLLDYRVHRTTQQHKVLRCAEGAGRRMEEFVVRMSLRNLIALLYSVVRGVKLKWAPNPK